MTKFSLLAAAAVLGLGAAVAQAEPATYNLDPTHTFVTFEIGHFNTSTNRGRFDKNSGTAVLDKAAKTGKLDVVVDTTSLNTGVEHFTKHVSSAEILDVAQFPKAEFHGDKFTFDDKGNVTSIAGSLTLHGKTNPVTLTADHFNCYMSPMVKHEVCGGDFEATIQRSQFGVNFGLDWGFPDAMRLVIQAEAVKQ